MEIPTWSFLVIAVILAVVVGRAGTLLRELLENRQAIFKRKRLERVVDKSKVVQAPH